MAGITPRRSEIEWRTTDIRTRLRFEHHGWASFKQIWPVITKVLNFVLYIICQQKLGTFQGKEVHIRVRSRFQYHVGHSEQTKAILLI